MIEYSFIFFHSRSFSLFWQPWVLVRTAFLIGRQNLLAASLRIGIGSRVLAALTCARAAAIQMFAIGTMTIAYKSVALTMRAV